MIVKRDMTIGVLDFNDFGLLLPLFNKTHSSISFYDFCLNFKLLCKHSKSLNSSVDLNSYKSLAFKTKNRE